MRHSGISVNISCHFSLCRSWVFVVSTVIIFYFPLIKVKAQTTETNVVVRGKVIQETFMGFTDLLIVNTSTGRGVMGNLDGTFEITAGKDDEIKVSCRGFKTVTLSMRDSIYKPKYDVKVFLELLSFTIETPVIIRPEPTYGDIQRQRSRIGSHVYRPLIGHPMEAFFHPVSALYQLFSRKEREKATYVALLNQKELENAQKDILRYLIKNGLFDLTEEELERFLVLCPLEEEFVKNASLYEITEAYKLCYTRLKGKKQIRY